jgi:hypothetical protein
MTPIAKKAKHRSTKSDAGWPLVVYVWMVGLAILGYLAGRIALAAFPHPLHWASGLAGAAVGCLIGWVWYRYKGDVA